ncbi:MAG: 5'/3'-nucleotidase SurE [Pseudomonadota bacterium]
MRILITNDDGITAPGLTVLHDIASAIAGAENVWTVAPAFEQSGVAHCISYTRPMMVSQLGPRRFAAEGSPADCVLAGLHDIMGDDHWPDLVLSGVNRGNNSAENALYSGTLGGALEAALQGLPAIALSQYYGPANAQAENPFEAAAQHGEDVIRRILAAHPTNDAAYGLFYNVNFPPRMSADVKGIRLAAQGRRPGVNFSTEPTQAPSGRRFVWIRGGNQQVATDAGTDAAVNLDGYISVTPMRADLTAHDALDLPGINS